MANRGLLRILLITATLVGNMHCTCNSSNDFYASSGAFDYYRLPLLKPYAAISPKTGNWSFDEHCRDNFPMEVRGGSLKKVYVANNFLYGFSELSHIENENKGFDTIYGYFIIADTSVIRNIES